MVQIPGPGRGNNRPPLPIGSLRGRASVGQDHHDHHDHHHHHHADDERRLGIWTIVFYSFFFCFFMFIRFFILFSYDLELKPLNTFGES